MKDEVKKENSVTRSRKNNSRFRVQSSKKKVDVLLLYPDTLEAALGSPGFRLVYRTLFEADDISVDWGWYDRKNERIVYESRRCNGRYDCIAFSVPYELLYFDVIRCLLILNIEPERNKRKQKYPLVIAGGAAPTINNEVAGTFADIVYIGEAEQYFADTVRQLVSDKNAGAAKQLTPMSGINIPDEKSAAPRFICPTERIDSSFLFGFDDPLHCTFKDAGLVEVGRGCSRGCRFCAAGRIYLPVRHRSVEDILS
ncbi:MAG: hypothetical protein HOC71_15140, partial [Candidatus Latescibacteria bacterium]|nr:hypothetical protein [Candidatus Latescibacterota bacterium]